MYDLEIKTVPFAGSELMAAKDRHGNIWAGVSYICNGIGFSKGQKDRQIKNIQADRVLRQGCVRFDAGVFDPNNETIALDLDYVPLWLAKINITQQMEAETPEVADRLEKFQLKAKDALAAAFIQQPMTAAQQLMAQAQVMVQMEQSIQELKDRESQMQEQISDLTEKVNKAVKVYTETHADHWVEDMDQIMKDLAKETHDSMPNMRGRLYDELERRTGCMLASRLTRLRRRKLNVGMRYKDAARLKKLDAIGADKQLRAVFESIVREHRAKYIEREYDPQTVLDSYNYLEVVK